MATIKLIPSTHAVSSSSYLSVSNADRMYDECDSTDYATITNTYSSTSSRYLYLRGFNFDDIPSAAVINSFTVKIRGYEQGLSTSTSYAPRLANGTSTLSGTTASDNFGTSAETITIPTGALTWEQITNYGSNFTIMVYVRRASRNTTGYFYCYGAEIDVDYTIPDPRTITTTLTGNGTITPSGTNTYYDGDEVELIITPTNKSDPVTATRDGVDITSQLVAHGAGSTVSAAPDDVSTSDIQSGSSYASYCIGHSAESPSSSGTSSNMYSSSGSTGYAAYTFDLSDVPSGAVIEEITATCYGHRESETIDSSHVSKIGIYNGSTLISDEEDFPDTSNSTISVTVDQSVSYSDLSNLTLRHYVGYYGGLVLGITFTVVYSTGTGIDHYTYTFTVSGNTTIAVSIGAVAQDTLFFKDGTVYAEVSKPFIKISGVWVEQTSANAATYISTHNVVFGGSYEPTPLVIGPITFSYGYATNTYSATSPSANTIPDILDIQAGDTIRITADEVYMLNVGSSAHKTPITDVDVSFVYDGSNSATLGALSGTDYGNLTYTLLLDQETSYVKLTVTSNSTMRDIGPMADNLYIRRV